MIRKVSIEALRPGMVVADLGPDIWAHHPYLYTEPGPLGTERDIAVIRAKGYKEAFIVVDQGLAGASDEETMADLLAGPLAGEDREDPGQPGVPLMQELPRARRLYVQSLQHVRRLTQAVADGNKLDVGGSQSLVGEFIGMALRNHQTLACLCKLTHFDDYTYTHGVNVAMLAVVFGRFLNMGQERLMHLGLAGLFHDLGKVLVDKAILNKPGRLSEAEYREMRSHAALTRSVLVNRRGQPRYGLPMEVVEAAAQHHEKFSGDGYPDSLPFDRISPLARILALADVYDALTSVRAYKRAMVPSRALSVMYGMGDRDFAVQEVQLFVKCLGVYPSGSLVRLSNGRQAVVVQSRSTDLLRPLLRIVPEGGLARRHTVDLATLPPEAAAALAIAESLDPDVEGVDLASLLGLRLPRAESVLSWAGA